jgi:hypothetical protein
LVVAVLARGLSHGHGSTRRHWHGDRYGGGHRRSGVARVRSKPNQFVVDGNAESDNVVENIHVTSVALVAENQKDLLDAAIPLFNYHPIVVVALEIIGVDVRGRLPHRFDQSLRPVVSQALEAAVGENHVPLPDKPAPGTVNVPEPFRRVTFVEYPLVMTATGSEEGEPNTYPVSSYGA